MQRGILINLNLGSEQLKEKPTPIASTSRMNLRACLPGIDIAKWVPLGHRAGQILDQEIKPYEGYLTRKVWDTTCLDLWVVQSPRKIFSLDKDSLQAGTVNVGVIEMDKAFRAVSGMECPFDPETGGPIEDAGWL